MVSESSAMGGFGGLVGIILVIALLGGGLGGLGGGNQGMTNDFLYTSLNNNTQSGFSNLQNNMNFDNLMQGQFGIQRDILSQTDVINNGMRDIQLTTQMGFGNLQSATQMGFAGLQHSQDMGFCGVNRSIDQVRFDSERNTNAIIQNATANTQRIVDWLSCNELKEANSRIAALEAERNKLEIIAAMKPVAPIPAYIQPSPYASYSAGGNGCFAV